MTDPDSWTEYRETMIVLRPGEPPVKARAPRAILSVNILR